MYGGNGGIFAAGSLSTRAKMPSLQICRPEIRRISGKSEEDVLKGDLSPFNRAIARDKSEFYLTAGTRSAIMLLSDERQV